MLRAVLVLAFAGLSGLAVAGPAAAAADQPRRGPDGPGFYDPPARLVPGAPGSIVWVRPADPLVRLPGARTTLTVLHRTRAIDGRAAVASMSLALPAQPPPAGGWRTVVFNHVTTGAAESCAPTRVQADSPEREKMTRADPTVRRMLAAGLAVARPDYEGIGTPGPHPYLIGRSLARTTYDAMRAARRADRRVGRRWLVAGHSEGGQATLFAAQGGRRAVPGLDLRGAIAMEPPTHMRDLLEAGRLLPVTGPGVADLSALAGLVLQGAALAEPRLARLYHEGGLSPRALALLPHLEQRCHLELAKADSWGGLAPSEIGGPRVDEALALLRPVLDANDPRAVRIPPDVPVRLDQGLLDPVVPFVFTEELVLGLRRNGSDVTYQRHPTATHQNITADDQAAGPATAWAVARLG